jgi:DNA-binding response OmpR family regulator
MSIYTQFQPSEQQQAASAPKFASILIVDDQRFDRTRLNRMCREFDFPTQVVEVDTLAAMRDKLKKERFDLVLLDYHLPDGTGLQGVDAVRADRVNSGAAVVMITGTEQTDIAVQALKLGLSDYLTKAELSQETLARAAITALQKARLAHGMTNGEAQRPPIHETLQSFSRECAQDIKPIVSRMMRQMRDIDLQNPQDAAERVEKVEGSLRRLWSFLDDLDQLGSTSPPKEPTIADQRGSKQRTQMSINARVPTTQRSRPETKQAKPPSIFRRRPD